MNPSNCMYGPPHSGAYLAVRSKIGRTIGWICASHHTVNERTLLKNGYHFRTQEELRARGELNDGDTVPGRPQESVDKIPDEEPQQSRSNDTGGSAEIPQLAPTQPPHHHPGRGPHGSDSDGQHQGGGSGIARTPIREASQELETRATGSYAPDPRISDRAPQDAYPSKVAAASERFALGVQGDKTPVILKSEWPEWCQGAGYLTLTPEQRAILHAPFDDSEVTIRYDGVVYVPWRKYWRRMVAAFAPYVPSVIPVDSPRYQGSEIVVGVAMVVEGKFVGKAWGSHRLEGANDKMSVGDRIESAISDAISKIGKRLDMAEELWDDSYRDYWKSQYAESYTNRGRTSWRRKAVTTTDSEEDDIDF